MEGTVVSCHTADSASSLARPSVSTVPAPAVAAELLQGLTTAD